METLSFFVVHIDFNQVGGLTSDRTENTHQNLVVYLTLSFLTFCLVEIPVREGPGEALVTIRSWD